MKKYLILILSFFILTVAAHSEEITISLEQD